MGIFTTPSVRRAVRVGAGYSTAEMATLCRVTPRTIRQWEADPVAWRVSRKPAERAQYNSVLAFLAKKLDGRLSVGIKAAI
jgi:DNA-binding XRE family transcriptional regulator